MKSKEKILSLISSVTLLSILLMPVKTHAALQANGSGASQKTINDWLSSVREMEAQGGTLGLTGSSSLTEVAGSDGKVANSNNLDIHMEKNTEYGAMAILSASNYGKSTPVHETANGLQTTTGNKSGVYITLNKEWVSAVPENLGTGNAGLPIENFKKAVGKYKNIYPLGYVAKAGDAITETKNWHTTGGTWNWLSGNWNISALVRAYSGSIFSYYGGNSSGSGTEAYVTAGNYSRAVIVLGSGF